MRKTANWGVVVLSVICAVVVGAWACHAQSKPPASKPPPSGSAGAKVTTVHDVPIEIDDAVMGFAKQKVPLTTVERGQGVRFIARNSDIWILIPSGNISMVSGGDDWAPGKTLISFKVSEGNSAVVKVDDDRHRHCR